MAQRTVQDTHRPAPAGTGARSRHALPRAAACVAGAILLYFAFPPAGLWFLAPPGVALLTLAVYRLPARRAAWLGYLGGAAFLLPALAWVRPIGVDAWLVLVAVESLFYAAMAAGAALVTRLRGWPVWVAALWVLQESARGAFPLGGFPWVRVAFSQGDSAFTPYAALGGAPLVTFAAALSGTLLALAAVRLAPRRPPDAPSPRGDAPVPPGQAGPRWVAAGREALWWPPRVPAGGAPASPSRRRAAGLACLLAGAVVVPLLGLAVPRPAPAVAGDRMVRIGVVQGDVPGEGLGFLGDQPAVVLRNHAGKTHELAAAVRAGRAARPDLVVWPENSTDIDPYRSEYARGVIDAAVRDIGVPVLVGAVVRTPDGEHRHTRAIVWDPEGGPGAYYDKRKLVPFGEFVPFKELLEKFFSRVDLVGLQSLPGTRDGALTMGPVTVGAISCYEVAFDGIVRSNVVAGGTPLVVQTNNATYAHTGLPPQQLAMTRLRAVEHGRAVVAAATTGISAYVDPAGELRWSTAEGVADMAVVEVPVRTGQTLATRLGALPEWALMLIGAGALAVALLRGRRAAPAAVRHDTTGEEDG
ncbi:apolipoprotein N-acyltransferase [Sphaerisporangium sp. TRM90804]|uniref:apolipoprotein N-acyltransferase n=1 Tax=Sphaerisporangium sp. TRM90804 TaxID=3031113 RepID=UPI00244D0BFA|nr:apolipoprotein N-acyltransferase [Sphaerisporangium sp. TRM90804]MDH2430534.1 apolipoprotein N-acyltransferase [Sphaerisporangium sp. TRM90804]